MMSIPLLPRIHLLLLAFMCLSFCTQAAAKPWIINYPNIDGVGHTSLGYSVLKLALNRANDKYRVIIAGNKVNQARARQLVSIKALDVFDTGIHPQLNDKFTPIYLPIDRGLNGWRLLLIHQDRAEQFQQVEDSQGLEPFIFGQGIGWSDIKILEQSNLKVVRHNHISTLIKMVEAKRFHALPLGVNEVHQFLKKFQPIAPHVTVEEALILHYPFARIFYVHKENEALAREIRKGLMLAQKDGSLEQLIRQHPFSRDAYANDTLAKRKVINLPSDIPLTAFGDLDKDWWFDPTNQQNLSHIENK